MNNEQQSLIDKAYGNYKSTILEKEIKKSAFELTVQSMSGKTFILPQEEFLNKCQTDSKFSEKWGLTIEERDLSLEERAQWLQDNTEWDLLVGNLDHDHIREVVEEEAPTKLIKVTYNDKTTESYE